MVSEPLSLAPPMPNMCVHVYAWYVHIHRYGSFISILYSLLSQSASIRPLSNKMLACVFLILRESRLRSIAIIKC